MRADGVKRLWRATINSWHGLIAATQSEQAFREELAVLAIGVPLAFFLTADIGKRFALIGVLVFILIIELLNTAIEKLVRSHHPRSRSGHQTHQGHGLRRHLSVAAAGRRGLALDTVAEQFWPQLS